jgi:hypothetical protein
LGPPSRPDRCRRTCHPVGDEDDRPTPDLADQLRAASTDGTAHEEFEKLVAKAFSQLDCTAEWIEEEGDTDVEIRSRNTSVSK